MTRGFSEYRGGRYVEVSIDVVCQRIDETPATRLARLLYEKEIVDAPELLDVLRLHGDFTAGTEYVGEFD